jgi:hypothetical protein
MCGYWATLGTSPVHDLAGFLSLPHPHGGSGAQTPAAALGGLYHGEELQRRQAHAQALPAAVNRHMEATAVGVPSLPATAVDLRLQRRICSPSGGSARGCHVPGGAGPTWPQLAVARQRALDSVIVARPLSLSLSLSRGRGVPPSAL